MEGGEKMNDIIVRLVDVPVDVKGIVKEDANGDYNIYLNARYVLEQQMMTYLHELAHIELGHLHSSLPVEELENEADKRMTEMLTGKAASRSRG